MGVPSSRLIMFFHSIWQISFWKRGDLVAVAFDKLQKHLYHLRIEQDARLIPDINPGLFLRPG